MRIKTVKVDEAKLFKLMAKNNVENLHQLGKLSGVSHDTVNRIFRENNSYTTLPTATCIAYALGVKVTDFIVLNDPKPEPTIVPESEKKMGGGGRQIGPSYPTHSQRNQVVAGRSQYIRGKKDRCHRKADRCRGREESPVGASLESVGGLT